MSLCESLSCHRRSDDVLWWPGSTDPVMANGHRWLERWPSAVSCGWRWTTTLTLCQHLSHVVSGASALKYRARHCRNETEQKGITTLTHWTLTLQYCTGQGTVHTHNTSHITHHTCGTIINYHTTVNSKERSLLSKFITTLCIVDWSKVQRHREKRWWWYGMIMIDDTVW